MTVAYLDTSAAMKLLVLEPGSAEVAALLSGLREPPNAVVASTLLATELHCAWARRSDPAGAAAISDVLELVTLVAITDFQLERARQVGPLRTLDAIHLAVALQVGAAAMISYDSELLRAAELHGLQPVSP